MRERASRHRGLLPQCIALEGVEIAVSGQLMTKESLNGFLHERGQRQASEIPDGLSSQGRPVSE